MKRLIRMSVFVLACQAVAVQAAPTPEWVSALPSDNAHVYAVGMASLADTSEAQALSTAGEAAKVELLTMLRANVKSEQSNTQTLNAQRKGDKEKSTFTTTAGKKTVITTRARDLPGLKVSETHIDRGNGSVYALAVLDLSAAAGEINRRQELVESSQKEMQEKSTLTLADFGEADRLLRGNAPALELASLLASRLAHQGSALEDADRAFRKLLTERKKAITFGMSQSTAGFDATALRAAVTGAGYAWSRSPRYSFTLESKINPNVDFAYNRHVARGQVNLQLLDSDGEVIQTNKIAGQGGGSSPEKARHALQRNLDEEIVSTVQTWLGGQSTNADAAAPAATDANADNASYGANTPGSDDRPVNWGTH